VYAGVHTLGFVVSRGLAARRHPDLLAERARSMQCENAEPWDKLLAPLVGLGGGLIPLVVGLDARFGWSGSFPLALKLAALVVMLAGWALGTYALVENRFFSGVVRIQRDRDHRVVTGGPYRWVRHPGYAGALLTYLATPIFLEAAWASLVDHQATFHALAAMLLCARLVHRDIPGRRRRVCCEVSRAGWRGHRRPEGYGRRAHVRRARPRWGCAGAVWIWARHTSRIE
jgi:protein-S-isoprenylcysteine O-methyltransferase Ste14